MGRQRPRAWEAFPMQDSVGQTPEATPDPRSGDPVAPRPAVILLIIWCAVEGTIFAFALRPTMSELASTRFGFRVNPIVLVVLLSVSLTLIIAGSFACIPVLKDAIKAKNIASILQMILVEIVVA